MEATENVRHEGKFTSSSFEFLLISAPKVFRNVESFCYFPTLLQIDVDANEISAVPNKWASVFVLGLVYSKLFTVNTVNHKCIVYSMNSHKMH